MKNFVMLVAAQFAAVGSAVAQEAKPSEPATATPVISQRAPDTLMFSIDELNEIRNRVAMGAQQGPDSARGESSAIEDASLYLSTILYYGPQEWTIWVNGSPIGPNQELKSFQVTDIGPSFVELLIPLSAQGMRPIRLSPNQTFITRSGSIVEGRWTR